MAVEELDITISQDGKVSITVKGLKGPECEKYVAVFQKILQGETTVEHTSEYYEQPVESTTTVKW